MDKPFHVTINLRDKTYQSLARVQLKELAANAGFTGHRLGEIEIIIAEITSNLSRHTTEGGTIFCKIGEDQYFPFIEFIAIDKGPGMQFPKKMMKDGMSTLKTLGQGLGAIQRLSTEFDLYSLPGWGTILFSRSYKSSVTAPSPVKMEVLRTAKNGETVCGDNWLFKIKGKQIRAAVIDGLGHGPEASKAAEKAVDTLNKLTVETPDQQLRSVHESLKRTRGVVMTTFQLDTHNRQASYCGVGNIAAKIIPRIAGSKGKTCNPYNGILGHTLPNSIATNYSHFDPKLDMLIVHSDGISARWDLSRYPAILEHHPMILCATLYKDYVRGNDDATIMVVQ